MDYRAQSPLSVSSTFFSALATLSHILDLENIFRKKSKLYDDQA